MLRCELAAQSNVVVLRFCIKKGMILAFKPLHTHCMLPSYHSTVAFRSNMLSQLWTWNIDAVNYQPANKVNGCSTAVFLPWHGNLTSRLPCSLFTMIVLTWSLSVVSSVKIWFILYPGSPCTASCITVFAPSCCIICLLILPFCVVPSLLISILSGAGISKFTEDSNTLQNYLIACDILKASI